MFMRPAHTIDADWSILWISLDAGDTRPSFYVNAHKNLFYCHGCQRGGDLIRFVELSQRLSFRDSLARLKQERLTPENSLISRLNMVRAAVPDGRSSLLSVSQFWGQPERSSRTKRGIGQTARLPR